MPTDDERRDVARRLRELDDSELQVYDMTYFAIQRAVGGEGDQYPDGRELADRLADLIEPEKVTGETSDGYHTFDELYDHRAKLFSVIVRDHRELAWKSRVHHDGTMYDEMFIVGVETPGGQATYHYDLDPYWGIFDCEELDRAPEWDGHTPQQAIDRIAALGPSCDRDALLALAGELSGDTLVVPAVYGTYAGGYVAACQDVARRIREACGMVDAG